MLKVFSLAVRDYVRVIRRSSNAVSGAYKLSMDLGSQLALIVFGRTMVEGQHGGQRVAFESIRALVARLTLQTDIQLSLFLLARSLILQLLSLGKRLIVYERLQACSGLHLASLTGSRDHSHLDMYPYQNGQTSSSASRPCACKIPRLL